MDVQECNNAKFNFNEKFINFQGCNRVLNSSKGEKPTFSSSYVHKKQLIIPSYFDQFYFDTPLIT